MKYLFGLLLLVSCNQNDNPSTSYLFQQGEDGPRVFSNLPLEIRVDESINDEEIQVIVDNIIELNIQLGFEVFRYKGMTNNPRSNYDRVNVITRGKIDSNKHGIASIQFVGTDIKECDIILNQDKNFFLYEVESDKVNFNNLIVHELLHCIGVSHQPSGIMQSYAYLGERTKYLTRDEIIEIRRVYGK